MPAENHRPLSSPDRPSNAPDRAEAVEIETVSEALVPPAPSTSVGRGREATVLPYYRSPRERLAQRERVVTEAFDPQRPAGPEEIPARDAAEASFGETAILEAVIGNDDRVKLLDALTRTNPWRQICSLRIVAASGSVYVGTAWFIGPRILATAGHCVYLRNAGGWAASIDVVPGRVGPTEPYGRASATRFAAVDGWVNTGGRDFDYGVIFLPDSSLGTKVGNFAVEAYADADLVGVTSRISGYPADRDNAVFQYYHERPLLSVTPTRLSYDIDTFGGQSGSPIWREDEGSPAVAIGIHTTGGVTGNSGTRISDEVIDNLTRWSGEA